MTPNRSTLRVSALYYARGMITLDEYRAFRRTWVQALLGGETPPEIPEEWHKVAPGTYSLPAITEDTPAVVVEPPPRQGMSRNTLAVLMAVLGVAIGGLAALLQLVP